MHRDVAALTNREFDVIVVGGGIYGACLAWEAVSRGLSVALLEKADFAWATSANMHRILHGGFRYLRNADVRRVRESVHERNTLMRLAPHLTDPLPFLLPTYPRGLQRRDVMQIALKLYDALSYDRNRGIAETRRRIPPGRIVSRDECLRLAPGLDPRGVTGGAIWHDGWLRDPARLALEFVRTAADAGACVANYVEVTGFLRKGSAVTGVTASDSLTGDPLSIRGSLVVSTTGPWINSLLGTLGPDAPRKRTPYVRSVDIVTRALTLEGHGLALMAPQDGAPERTIRYFIAPWRGLSVLGSVDYLVGTDPDDVHMNDSELDYLIGVVRSCMPGAALGVDDVHFLQAGLIPHAATPPLDDPYNAARHWSIVDHGTHDGVDGLLSVTGIKYTTARDIAQKTVDLIRRKLGKAALASRTATTPLHGGHIEHVDAFVESAIARPPHGLSSAVMEQLVRTYGSGYREVLAHVRDRPGGGEPIAPPALVIEAQVVHAVRAEMAQRLSDVILRRTEAGTIGHPGPALMHACARLMAGLLNWSPKRTEDEIAATEAYLARFWARRSGPSPASPGDRRLPAAFSPQVARETSAVGVHPPTPPPAR